MGTLARLLGASLVERGPPNVDGHEPVCQLDDALELGLRGYEPLGPVELGGLSEECLDFGDVRDRKSTFVGKDEGGNRPPARGCMVSG
jgi:hypothetical protein